MYTEEHCVALISRTWTDGVSIFAWTQKQEWLSKKTRFHKHGSVTAGIFHNMDQAKLRYSYTFTVALRSSCEQLSETFAEVLNFCPFLISNLPLFWNEEQGAVTKQLRPAIVAEHLFAQSNLNAA